MSQNDSNLLFHERLSGLTKLYDKVNETLILHEYTTGEFHLDSLKHLSLFTDKLFYLYQQQETISFEEDFIHLESQLNKAGHAVLVSILTFTINKINNIIKDIEYDVIAEACTTYREVDTIIIEAEKYTEQFEKIEELNISFFEAYDEYISVVKFWDQLKNNQHILKSKQKNRNKKSIFDILFGGVQNLLITVMVFFVTLYVVNSSKEHKASIEHVTTPHELEADTLINKNSDSTLTSLSLKENIDKKTQQSILKK